ncbi:hypothetical protein BH10CYA1_BH10CYA1_63290 [soil metagenome]
MFENDVPSPIQELQWLMHYYSMRGHTEKAKKILRELASQPGFAKQYGGAPVVDMFKADEKRA